MSRSDAERMASGRYFHGSHSLYIVSELSIAPVPATDWTTAYQTLLAAFSDDPVPACQADVRHLL